jgi:beta-glucosidase
LTGKVNPSGKLPMTFPVNLIDHASSSNFPMDGEPLDVKSLMIRNNDKPLNKQQKNKDFTLYDEGIYVGYRHFDKAKIDVSYPFGFGLSYTNFKYSNLQLTKTNDNINLSVEIENTGDYDGKEIVQVYLSKINSEIDRPKNELKAFLKTPNLVKGESTRLQFSIPVSNLAYWSEDENGWKVESGNYLLKVGASSRDIKLIQNINI